MDFVAFKKFIHKQEVHIAIVNFTYQFSSWNSVPFGVDNKHSNCDFTLLL